MRRFGFLLVAVIVLALLVPMSAAAEPAESTCGSGCSQWYTVRYGDTLSKIARMFGTTVSRLVALNGIADPDRIYAGQVLCVAGCGGHHDGGYHPGGFYYRVKYGDTLAKIAWRYGFSVWYLARINGICNPNYIWVGQLLWIPAHSGYDTVPAPQPPGEVGGED